MKQKLSASHLSGQSAETGKQWENTVIFGECICLKVFFKIQSVYKSGYFCVSAFLMKASILGGAGTISKENLINEEIRDKEVRVIDTDGSQLGIMPIEEALDLANERKLDLVNISPNAKPAVCKILDYGKYRYELQKKEKEAKKKQKVTQVKEIRLSTFIEEHDIQVKAKIRS